MRRILCLHLPYLPTERARRDAGWAGEPRRPLGLTRPAGAAVVVEQVCPHARQLGLRPGVSLGQAQALVPGLAILPYEPQRDRATLERLAEWALRFSPVVEPVDPDTLLVDIAGCELLFGGEENIAVQAVAGLARQGFYARAAIADTVGAAYALASKAPLVLARAGPRGLKSAVLHAARSARVIVPNGQTSAWLTPLPPAALRIEPQVSERLAALGILSIGDLLMLPRASLPARFGPQLVLRLQQALGEVFEGVTPHRPEELPAARLRFETPVTDGPAIRTAAERLLGQVLTQVLSRQAALRRLDCVIYFGFRPGAPGLDFGLAADQTPPATCGGHEVASAPRGRRGIREATAAPRRPRGGDATDPSILPCTNHCPTVQVVSIGLARASRERAHIAKLLAQRLEQIDLTPGVVGLMLLARETSRWHGTQAELFEPREPGDEEALGGLIDRLAGRLGDEAVVRPQLVDDHQPEMAFRYVSVAEAGCEAEDTARASPASDFGFCPGAPGLDFGLKQAGTPAPLMQPAGTPAPLIQPAGTPAPLIQQAGTPAPLMQQAEMPAPLAAPLRPVRLLARPVPIRVIALVPDGPPTWLLYRGREYVIAQAAGPERLETAWWRGPDVRRDYFRVSAETGEQFWIFHAADERQWYLHGVFA